MHFCIQRDSLCVNVPFDHYFVLIGTVYFYGLESWIGVLDRSIGLEFWNKTLEWNRKFNSRDTIYLYASGGHFKTCNKCIKLKNDHYQ